MSALAPAFLVLAAVPAVFGWFPQDIRNEEAHGSWNVFDRIDVIDDSTETVALTRAEGATLALTCRQNDLLDLIAAFDFEYIGSDRRTVVFRVDRNEPIEKDLRITFSGSWSLSCEGVTTILEELTPLVRDFQQEAEAKGAGADLSHHAEAFNDLAARIPDGQDKLKRTGDLLWSAASRYGMLAQMWRALDQAGIENELRIAREDLEGAVAAAARACGELVTAADNEAEGGDSAAPKRAIDTVAHALRPNDLGVTADRLRARANPHGQGVLVYVPETRFAGAERFFLWLVLDGTAYPLNGATKGSLTPNLSWPRDFPGGPDAWQRRVGFSSYSPTKVIETLFGEQ